MLDVNQQQPFALAKKVVAKEMLLANPDFNKPFHIHVDASHYQLGAVVSQAGWKDNSFLQPKVEPSENMPHDCSERTTQHRGTLKECHKTLLGHAIEAFTDHKNLVDTHFNAE